MTGPRFIPFEAMTEAEQVEHLRRMHLGHGLLIKAQYAYDHQDCHLVPCQMIPHTHDKPAPQ